MSQPLQSEASGASNEKGVEQHLVVLFTAGSLLAYLVLVGNGVLGAGVFALLMIAFWVATLLVKTVSLGPFSGTTLRCSAGAASMLSVILTMGGCFTPGQSVERVAAPEPKQALTPLEQARAQLLEPQSPAELKKVHQRIRDLNKDKIDAELAELKENKKNPKRYVYLLRDSYTRLVALDPGNKEYFSELAKYSSRIANIEYDIEHPVNYIKIVRQGWSIGGFGMAYILDITLRNTGDRSWGDFTIKCRNAAASGTELDPTIGKIMDKVRPGQTKRFRHIVLGPLPAQTTGSSCEVTDVEPL